LKKYHSSDFHPQAGPREEWLFTNRFNRPDDDMKDEVREATTAEAWRLWTAE